MPKKLKTKKQKPSTSTSRRGVGRPPGVKVPGSDKIFMRSYPGEDPRHEEHGDPVPDLEKTLPEPDDDLASHTYPPPKKHPTFRKIWGQHIDNIVSRENFKVGHLNSLEILCDLHVDYEDLREFLRTRGRTYKAYSRQGLMYKFYPEVQQLNNVQNQIKDYMKLLGLTPGKDKSPQSGGEKENWE